MSKAKDEYYNRFNLWVDYKGDGPVSGDIVVNAGCRYIKELEEQNKKLKEFITNAKTYNNSELINGADIDEETAFLLDYNKTVKSHYKEQKEPFEL